MALTSSTESSHLKRIAYLSLTAALVAIALAVAVMLGVGPKLVQNPEERHSSNPPIASKALARIKNTGVLRVGYGGFPPYTIVNPNATDSDKSVTGFVADMVKEIASRSEPPLKIEWYRLNWETFRADMASDRFDFLADAVYQTIPKALDYGLTDPFGFFGIAAAVVRIDDSRFKEFRDLDRNDITIALAQGYVTSDFAQKELSKPKFKIVPVGADAFVQMDEVVAGRADVALNDVPTVVQYVSAHPDKVKALWTNHPPSTVPAGFITNLGETELLGFLNAGIRILQTDGTLVRLDEKWKTLGHFQDFSLVPGYGLSVKEK